MIYGVLDSPGNLFDGSAPDIAERSEPGSLWRQSGVAINQIKAREIR
jgi:hypothetical protein